MHIVILGAGVVGIQIATQLINEGKDVVLIEKDPVRAKYVSNHLDCIVINEEGNNLASLKRAGIHKADFFISVTNSDEINMIACGLVSSEFKVPVKIARVRNLDYSGARIVDKTFLGIDYIVNSEVETARQIANTVALGADSDVMLFENTDLQMRNISIQSNSFFKDQSLRDIRQSVKESFLLAGIIRDNEFIIPSGETVLREHDTIYLLATKAKFTRIFMETGKKRHKLDRIFIVGGGRIGALVCQYLIRTGRKITIIDNDYDNCKELSENFPDALVINADISEDDIFDEEQLNTYDLIVTTTDNQELNILTSIYAKSMGTHRAIALVTKSNYLPIASKLDIDATISPKNSTVDAIMKFIRRGDIKSVHSIFDGKAEVIEFYVDEKNRLANCALKDINMPADSLILSVVRGSESILPDGSLEILPGDLVLIIASKTSILQIEEFFQV